MNSANSPGRGLTAYRVRSALVVASLIDHGGSAAIDARQSYHYLTLQGGYPPNQLQEGEALLRQLQLVDERDGNLYAAEGLRVLAHTDKDTGIAVLLLRALQFDVADVDSLREAAEGLIADPARRESLLVTLGRRYLPQGNRELGEAGEELVVSVARSQLVTLGREDLAARVCRVSLASDQLGYDITAPRLTGAMRLLEVKTCRSACEATVGFFLSRNEADTGLRFRDWALVICKTDEGRELQIVGWCAGWSLRPYLPTDGAQSEWTQARLTIPTTLLIPGLPDPA